VQETPLEIAAPGADAVDAEQVVGDRAGVGNKDTGHDPAHGSARITLVEQRMVHTERGGPDVNENQQ
jgi:hypothetical protein